MTTRRQRRSTTPLSFYGIKFKMSAAAIVPAKPLNESAQQKENHPPDRNTQMTSMMRGFYVSATRGRV